MLVLAWIAIDGKKEMPANLSKSLETTELAEYDAVHLLTYLGLAFILFLSFPAMVGGRSGNTDAHISSGRVNLHNLGGNLYNFASTY